MNKEFKYPCAVKTDGLTEDQGNALQEAFIALGAYWEDSYRASWNYYGVDCQGSTNCYSDINSFSTGAVGEVLLYTYDEVMSFVEEPATKKLEFPCAMLMSEIDSEETWNKVKDIFVTSGAYVFETYDKGVSCKYVGVDFENEGIHYNSTSQYCTGEEHCTVYTLEEILSFGEEATEVPDEDNPWIENTGEMPVDEGTLVDVKYVDGSESIGIAAGLPARNSSFRRKQGKWVAVNWGLGKYDSNITHWRLHEPPTDTSVASCDSPQDTLEETQGVIMGEVCSASSGFSVTLNQTYTVTIKGQSFDLTSDEFQKLKTVMEVS